MNVDQTNTKEPAIACKIYNGKYYAVVKKCVNTVKFELSVCYLECIL